MEKQWIGWNTLPTSSTACDSALVPIQKWQICPISALRGNFNPRNINHMPAVKFFARVPYPEQIILSLDGHALTIYM
jgi:hypothetical protein